MTHMQRCCASTFLSTLSLRRATRRGGDLCYLDNIISIHALLAESDLPVFSWRCPLTYFYPRSPCGERLKQLFATIGTTIFLSTLSLRRATLRAMAAAQDNAISIHALLAESDISSSGVSAGRMHFYPRSPCGERRRNGCHGFYSCLFLSTLSLRRATLP